MSSKIICSRCAIHLPSSGCLLRDSENPERLQRYIGTRTHKNMNIMQFARGQLHCVDSDVYTPGLQTQRRALRDEGDGNFFFVLATDFDGTAMRFVS